MWTVSYHAERSVCVDKSAARAAKNRPVHFRGKKQ
jgi:hypothetical protein